ncbi:hypothetical protein KY359_04615 [Candidatus Woesearchaeota archaeon]|nr:hypothetical protein [Candidatus Woesearchaeota archaeon]
MKTEKVIKSMTGLRPDELSTIERVGLRKIVENELRESTENGIFSSDRPEVSAAVLFVNEYYGFNALDPFAKAAYQLRGDVMKNKGFDPIREKFKMAQDEAHYI